MWVKGRASSRFNPICSPEISFAKGKLVGLLLFPVVDPVAEIVMDVGVNHQVFYHGLP